jgi:hypothetical protein
MTQKANPSINRPAEAFKTAGAIAYGGHGGDGFVVDGTNPTDISVQDGGITEADLNSFAETSGGASLDVTIDGGEAFVFGSWIAIDTDTTVTLASSTTGQTVYVGWNKNGSDDVIVGLDGAFSSASGDRDERIPLFDFDTDGSGVTNVVDRRSFDQINADSIEQGSGSGLDADLLDGNEASELGVDVSNDGTTVTTNSSDINFSSDITASGDFDGTSTVSLTNNSVTVSSGDGLSGGGNVSLGSSTTLDINPSDFAGSGLTTDGNDNLDLSNDSVTVSSGTDLTGGGSVSLGGSITIDHADTSTQGDVTTSAPTIVDDITLDGNGHVSGLGTQNRDLNDWDVPSDFNINNADKFGLPQRTSDPSASVGDIWYRTDLD